MRRRLERERIVQKVGGGSSMWPLGKHKLLLPTSCVHVTKTHKSRAAWREGTVDVCWHPVGVQQSIGVITARSIEGSSEDGPGAESLAWGQKEPDNHAKLQTPFREEGGAL